MENFLSAYEEFHLRTYGSILPVDEVQEIENNASANDAAAWWCENQRELQMLADEMNFGNNQYL